MAFDRGKRIALARDISRKVEALNMDLIIAAEEGLVIDLDTQTDYTVKAHPPVMLVCCKVLEDLARVKP